MKKTAVIGILLLAVLAIPAFAQGPFADVPTDHWAYQAVNDLQQRGILLGYPDGTFQGKRAITRYEFAVAIARILGTIQPTTTQPFDPSGLERRISALEARQIPDVSNFATKADLDTLRRLMDQFRDELAALGVDVDALKRQVAALNDRVAAVEREQARVKVNGEVWAGAIATNVDEGLPFDRDNRAFPTTATTDDYLESVTAIFNGKLDVRGRLTDNAAAYTTLVYGNYLDYLAFVDDYANGVRPTAGIPQVVFPYYAYLDMGFGSGKFTVGRQPIQFTPYTLRLIDVDTYFNDPLTDSGDYPVDAARIDWKLGGVSLLGYAGKHNGNDYLANGLTSQANGGLYQTGVFAPFNLAGGRAAGGLGSIDQSAGVRALIGTPFNGNLGLNYIRVAGTDAPGGIGVFDQADIFGADLNLAWRRFNIYGEYAQTNTLAVAGADLEDLNQAFDGRIGTTFGGLGLALGYRSVELNFTAPGAWDKFGRWANPSNIQGPYLDASYGLTPGIRLVANGAFYNPVNDVAGLPVVVDDEDDDLWKATVGLKWGISPAWSVDAGYEFYRFSPSEGGDADETYLTIGAAWQINPSAGLKLAYQIADYDDEGAAAPYGAGYKGQLAVAQFGVKF